MMKLLDDNNELLFGTWVTLSSAWVRLSSAAALSARSCARSSSWEVVKVVRPNVVYGWLVLEVD